MKRIACRSDIRPNNRKHRFKGSLGLHSTCGRDKERERERERQGPIKEKDANYRDKEVLIRKRCQKDVLIRQKAFTTER